MAAGDFSAADLQVIDVKASQMALDPNNRASQAQVTAGVTLLNKQKNANRFEVLTDSEKDRDVKVYWISDCGNTVADCTTDCDFDSDEAEAESQVYSISNCKEATFKVTTKKFRDSNLSPQEVIAFELARKKKEMDEHLAQYMVSTIESFAGSNAVTTAIDPRINGVTAFDNYVTGAYWTPDIMSLFSKEIILNKMGSDSFLLSGDNLYNALWQADMNKMNADGKGDYEKATQVPIAFDLFNMDATLGAKKTLLIDPASYAFVSKTHNTSTIPVEILADRYKYKTMSDNLPGVEYDVEILKKCVADDDIAWVYRIKARYDLFNNPQACADTYTGVISHVCGTNP